MSLTTGAVTPNSDFAMLKGISFNKSAKLSQLLSDCSYFNIVKVFVKKPVNSLDRFFSKTRL
jgi:hypothetical protein